MTFGHEAEREQTVAEIVSLEGSFEMTALPAAPAHEDESLVPFRMFADEICVRFDDSGVVLAGFFCTEHEEVGAVEVIGGAEGAIRGLLAVTKALRINAERRAKRVAAESAA